MKYAFPKNFLFGSATSGPQSEGFYNKANESIWDYWYKIDKTKFHNEVGSYYASRFFETFSEDIKLIKKMGHNSFRTSIQWSRLIKNFYTLEVDKNGADFYNNLINELIKNDIEPIICLYHFDMPLTIQHELGGWENKKTATLYAQYAKTAFELFGDRVKKWITFNEPVVISEGAYLYKWHYPCIVSFKKAVQVGYNLNLASAMAISQYKKLNLNGEIGIVLNLTPSYPRDVNNKEDLHAAKICDALFNRSFLDPAIHGKFPSILIDFLKENNLMPDCSSEENEIESKIIEENTVSFLGVNYYQPRRVKHKEDSSVINNKFEIMPEDFFSPYEMPGRIMNPHRGWEIYYKGIYDIAINIRDNYKNIKWMITENGIGVEGEERFIKDCVVEDDYRIEFVKEHLKYLHKAMSDGANCFGYHMWTFIDCWSWLNSYKNRYGFVRYDLETKDKVIKKSGYWIKEVIKNNGFDD